MPKLKRVAVYCGSSDNIDPIYRDCARRVGRLFGERGVGVVYGGGRRGLMGDVADAALEAGGEVYGVIPDKLQALEVGHTDVTDLFVVDSMHARKAMMANLADAYVALPGGLGTREELFEVTTLAVLGYHAKPIALLNFRGYYNHLTALLDHAAATGFVRPEHHPLIRVVKAPEDLLEVLSGPPIV